MVVSFPETGDAAEGASWAAEIKSLASVAGSVVQAVRAPCP